MIKTKKTLQELSRFSFWSLAAICLVFSLQNVANAQKVQSIEFARDSDEGISQAVFGCNVNQQEIPTLVVVTEDGKTRSLIAFTSNYFDAPPIWRCQQVASQFSLYGSRKELEYIVLGFENGYNVLCAAKSPNEGCNGRILLTIKPEDTGILADKVRNANNWQNSATSKETEESAFGSLNSSFSKVILVAPFTEAPILMGSDAVRAGRAWGTKKSMY